jgi:hypothetical protein
MCYNFGVSFYQRQFQMTVKILKSFKRIYIFSYVFIIVALIPIFCYHTYCRNSDNDDNNNNN